MDNLLQRLLHDCRRQIRPMDHYYDLHDTQWGQRSEPFDGTTDAFYCFAHLSPWRIPDLQNLEGDLTEPKITPKLIEHVVRSTMVNPKS